MNFENRPTHSLRPYPANARTHSPKQIKQIARSIERFGFNNPVLVDDDDQIIAGHGRFTPDNEETIHFASGDTLFFEANTEGLWEVDETMRKVYVIL